MMNNREVTDLGFSALTGAERNALFIMANLGDAFSTFAVVFVANELGYDDLGDVDKTTSVLNELQSINWLGKRFSGDWGMHRVDKEIALARLDGDNRVRIQKACDAYYRSISVDLE